MLTESTPPSDDIKPVGRDILERYRHFARRIGKGRGRSRYEDGREQVARGVPPYCVDDIVGFGFQPGTFEGVVTLYELCGKILLEACLLYTSTPELRRKWLEEVKETVAEYFPAP